MWEKTRASYCLTRAGAALMGIMLCLSVLSCSKSDSHREPIAYDTTDLRNGDLLFRNGYGYESWVVTDMSSGNYSHIGMAYHTPSGWFAIHAVPGEAEEGEPEYLKCEPIAEFYRADRAQAGARARVDCDDSVADAAIRHAIQLVERQVVFDNDYNLDDSNQLYCTELVRLVYLSCGVDLCEDRRHNAPIIAKTEVIYPEDIWNSPLVIHKKKF